MSNIFASIGIDPGIIIILLMIITIVLIGMVVYLNRVIKRLEAKYHLFMKGEDGRSLEKGFMRKFNQIEKMSDIQDNQADEMKMIEAVKYDAFEDVGGKLSFALALLDNTDTGFVLNAIHSKENCFLYIKEVMNGESYIILSDEEIHALRQARKYGDDKAVD